MKRRPAIILGLLVLLAVAGGLWFLYWMIHPSLSIVDPLTALPDDTISLIGKNFGKAPGELLFDGISLSEHSIQSWSPTYISFKMPNDVETATVRVKTSLGTSNPLMLANSTKVPKPVESQTEPELRPNIKGTKPTSGIQIGKTITISGSHFGDPNENSSVFFTRVPSISEFETENPNNFIKISSADSLIDRWGNASIVVHIPGGVENGYVFIKTKSGTSNTYPVSFSRSLGRTWRGETTEYIIEQKTLVSIGASQPEGRLLIFLPKPTSTLRQSVQTDVQGVGSHLSMERQNWEEFRFDQRDAAKGPVELTRRFTIQASEMRADINVGSIQPMVSAPAFLAPYLAPDMLIQSDNETIIATARAIQKKDKNSFRQVALAAQWVFSNIKLNEKDQGLFNDIPTVLKNKSGGARALALVGCAILRALGIPAIPVSGFLVTEDGRLIPHYWGEYYLLGIGWIPFDAALATGKVPDGFVPGFAERLTYYRGIDNKHIAVSRGYQPLPPVQPDAQKKKRIPWSFLEYDELAQGIGYTTIWSQPTIVSATSP